MLVPRKIKVPVVIEKEKKNKYQAPKIMSISHQSRPELCLKWTWPTQAISLRIWGYETCIATSDIVSGWIDCASLLDCPVIIDILEDIDELQTDIGNICDSVANCIATDPDTQTALLNWLEALTNVNLSWTWNFDWPVFFNDEVNIGAWPLNYNSTVTNWTQNFSDTYVGNYDGSTINYTNTTQNYNAPSQISCEPVVSFWVAYVFPANTDFVEVKVTNGLTQYTINKSINTWTTSYNVGTWIITITVTATDVTVNDISLTNTLDSICYYEGNVINQNGTIYNNTNVTTYNTGSNTYNDPTTNTYGGNYINNTFNNPTFTGSIGIGMAWYNEPTPFTGWPASTVLNLTNTPNGDVLVSLEGWVIQLEPSDYTHVANTNTVTMNIDTTGQNILVSYIIGTTNTMTVISKKVTWATRTWPSNTITIVDPDCLPWSVILWWTITTGTQIWFWEFIMWSGSFDINSTTNESGLVFNYVIVA